MQRPKAPKEDPNVKAAREREERRAEKEIEATTRDQLDRSTLRRLKRFGMPAGGVNMGGGGLIGATSGQGSGGVYTGGGGLSGAIRNALSQVIER